MGYPIDPSERVFETNEHELKLAYIQDTNIFNSNVAGRDLKVLKWVHENYQLTPREIALIPFVQDAAPSISPVDRPPHTHAYEVQGITGIHKAFTGPPEPAQ